MILTSRAVSGRVPRANLYDRGGFVDHALPLRREFRAEADARVSLAAAFWKKLGNRIQAHLTRPTEIRNSGVRRRNLPRALRSAVVACRCARGQPRARARAKTTVSHPTDRSCPTAFPRQSVRDHRECDVVLPPVREYRGTGFSNPQNQVTGFSKCPRCESKVTGPANFLMGSACATLLRPSHLF